MRAIPTRGFPSAAAFLLALALSSPGSAQEATTAETHLLVFLDCPPCDFDHVRRNIPFVEWVRDRADAGFHALVSVQPTGGGGSEYTIRLLGRGGREGIDERIVYVSDRNDSDEEVRAGVTQSLKLGLVRYLAGTPQAERIQVIYVPERAGEREAGRPDDPWDLWVFRLGLEGSVDGQSSTSSFSVSGNAAANRTSEDWKFNLRLNGSYREDRFEFQDSPALTSVARAFGARGLLVRSAGDRWSVGGRASAQASTFFNQDLTVQGGPAVEYNVFPYRESTERQLRFLYSVTANRYAYREETIYLKTEEVLFAQAMSVTFDVLQPWGSATFELSGSTLLTDLAQNRLILEGSADWRVVRGVGLTLFGSVGHIADQRSLPAGGVTDEEVLLRRRELATSFQYLLSLGVSFSFGSPYANVVNPRFGS